MSVEWRKSRPISHLTLAADLPPTPPALTEREIERSLAVNMLSGVLGMVWAAVAYGMPLPLLMRAVAASGFELGVLAALRQAAMLAQLPGAFLIERFSRRKPFWAAIVILHRAMWFIPALMPLLFPHNKELWPLGIILALGLSDVLAHAGTAAWFSWMADLLPAERAGRFWGMRQRVLSIAIVAASLACGVVLDVFTKPGQEFLGFTIVFAAAATFGVADIVAHLWVAEPAPAPGAMHERWWRRIAEPLRDRDFLRLTLAFGAWTCALALPGYSGGIPGFFNVVYLKESFGASYSQASWIIIASALSAVFWAPWIGRLIDRWGARKVALRLMAIGPIGTLAWFFASPVQWQHPLLGPTPVPQAVVLISAMSLLVGGLYGGAQLCQMRLTQAHTTSAGRTVAMAVHWSIVGLITALGPLAAGAIKDHFPAGLAAIALPGGTPFSYFQVLILLQLAIAWGIALPLVRGIRG